MFKEKSAIIFDFDGTIADTFHLHEQAFHRTLGDYPLHFSYGDYLGMTTLQAFRLIFDSNKVDPGEEALQHLVRTKQQYANQLYRESIRFIADAREFIELLYQHQYRLYVGSSGSRMNVTAGLQALGIDQYFSDVVTANDITFSKPHPEIFQKVLDRHGIDPTEALVIEDALSGIEAAHSAGIEVVCVDTTLVCDDALKERIHLADFSTLIEQFKTEFDYA